LGDKIDDDASIEQAFRKTYERTGILSLLIVGIDGFDGIER